MSAKRAWIITKDVDANWTKCFSDLMSWDHIEHQTFRESLTMTESTISLALGLIAIYGHLTSAQALSPHFMEIDEPANIYVLREPFHRRRPPWRPHKSFSNQVQEYWDRLQKEFFREWYRGHCPSPIQLEMLYSRLFFARQMMMLMMMMKLFNGGIQHDKSIHLIIRYWNDFHSETSSIMFLNVFRVYLMPKRHFLCRTSHSGFE